MHQQNKSDLGRRQACLTLSIWNECRYKGCKERVGVTPKKSKRNLERTLKIKII